MSKASGVFGNVQFCPKCGVQALARDTYRFETTGSRKGLDGYPEFLCEICGFGFRITPSYRHTSATAFFKAQRRLRPNISTQELNAQFDGE